MANKEQLIMRVLRREYESAHWKHIKATAEQAAAIAASQAWDDYNPQDGIGGFS